MAKSNLESAMKRQARPTAVKLAKTDEQPANGRPGRDNKSPVTGFFTLDVKKQLRILAAEKSMTIQRMLGEALNAYFEKNGKPAIIQLDDE